MRAGDTLVMRPNDRGEVFRYLCCAVDGDRPMPNGPESWCRLEDVASVEPCSDEAHEAVLRQTIGMRTDRGREDKRSALNRQVFADLLEARGDIEEALRTAFPRTVPKEWARGWVLSGTNDVNDNVIFHEPNNDGWFVAWCHARYDLSVESTIKTKGRSRLGAVRALRDELLRLGAIGEALR